MRFFLSINIVLLLLSGCKAPEINTLTPRQCPYLAGDIKASSNPDNAKEVTYKLDNINGAVHSITWVISGDSIQNGKNEYTKTFETDGNYSATAILEDSCGKQFSVSHNVEVVTYVAIPDTAFENKLIELGIDSERVRDGRIKESDALKVTSLDVSGTFEKRGNIRSLEGIQYFVNLKTLGCDGNKISKLDLSNNLQLEELYCNINEIVELEISKNTKLRHLQCYQNKITKLNLTELSNLQYVYCNQNKIITLDLHRNAELIQLICEFNLLTNLNVKNLTKLMFLNCGFNSISELVVDENKELTLLLCEGNNLSNLDLSNNLKIEQLWCYSNPNLQTICVSDLEKAKLYENTRISYGNMGYKYIKDYHTQWSTCEPGYNPGSTPGGG
jgi:hypothetical protein